MDIIFLKEYKNHKKGDIINVVAFKGKSLIKKGIAEVAPEHFVIGDLVVADIIKANAVSDKVITNNEFVHKGIFMPLEGRMGNLGQVAYQIPDEYIHCLTKRNYNPSLMQGYRYFDDSAVGEYFVDVSTITPFSKYFLKTMVSNGLSEDMYLTRQQIQKLELDINNKNIDNENERV